MPQSRNRALNVSRSNGSIVVDASRVLLGLGSIVFAAWGLVNPRGLAQAMGDHPRYARPLGIRDGVIGAALLASRSPAPLVARMAADLSDAARLASRSPRVAAGAAAIAVLGLVTFLAAVKK